MNLNIKNKNYSLDDLARDIAREVVLSPFVLSDDDMRAALRGIPSKELTIFVDRVKYHIPDFGNVSEHFVCQTLDHWLSGVRTKEDLKLGSPSVSLEGESFPCDRGKYYFLADGRIEKCEKAKREFEWPGVSFFFELSPDKAALAMANTLVSTRGLAIEPRGSFPIEDYDLEYALQPSMYLCRDRRSGRLDLLTISDGKVVSVMPFDEYVEENLDFSLQLCSNKLQEERKIEFENAGILDSLSVCFEDKADALIGLFGFREKRDFLYDSVPLCVSKNDSAFKCFLRRSVDSKSYFICVEPVDASSIKADACLLGIPTGYNSPRDLSFEQLRSVVGLLDRTYDELSTARAANAARAISECVELEHIDCETIMGERFTASMVYVSSDGSLVVGGFSGDNKDVTVPLASLTDSSIESIGEKSRLLIEKRYADYPRPDLKPLVLKKSSGQSL